MNHPLNCVAVFLTTHDSQCITLNDLNVKRVKPCIPHIPKSPKYLYHPIKLITILFIYGYKLFKTAIQ